MDGAMNNVTQDLSKIEEFKQEEGELSVAAQFER